MSGSISEVEAQPVQPTAASTADVPSTSADIEVDNENDASTMDDRILGSTHTVMVKIIGNTLFLAPFDETKTHRILDIGTGTGATEMGDFFPNAEVTGIDLSPIQPSWVPPNVKVEVDDVESP
ncbi:methyltransferase domain-containing protein [Colletotrichum tamarilloi]|uniref:Methyltransferase domain-containing protein n=1 Tax=Colletotrichum tamarilloi TaxID=1209934 RepID=A0ABQ9QP15_9PEZI|nr:methyltransferase domain-containing protein [Colletotrichum tamarilloi]KAK1479787.1 methyltransferase domain-containing protein [Colletotrichum tamarilloi]